MLQKTKKCTECNEIKTRDEFPLIRKSREWIQPKCKICHALIEKKRRAAFSESQKKHARCLSEKAEKLLTSQNRKALLAYLLEHQCVDCGEVDPIVLTFDHVGVKNFAISQKMNKYNWFKLLEEIETNCVVRCHNCQYAPTQ